MTNTVSTTRISSKGQVIIPKSLRDANHWTVGTALLVEQTADGIVLRPVRGQNKQDAGSALRRIQERIGYHGKPVSVTEMNQAVADEAARRGGR